MRNRETIQQLKKDAIAKGLCDKWQKKFKDNIEIPALVRMYIKGIDFCIINDYPALNYLRTEIKGKCEAYGVFVDDIVQASNLEDVVLNGKCKAELDYFGYSVCRIYARHDSEASIKASENAYLTIDAFDDSILNIEAFGKSKVNVSQYGDSKINISGNTENVTVKLMNKKTY